MIAEQFNSVSSIWVKHFLFESLIVTLNRQNYSQTENCFARKGLRLCVCFCYLLLKFVFELIKRISYDWIQCNLNDFTHIDYTSSSLTTHTQPLDSCNSSETFVYSDLIRFLFLANFFIEYIYTLKHCIIENGITKIIWIQVKFKRTAQRNVDLINLIDLFSEPKFKVLV